MPFPYTFPFVFAVLSADLLVEFNGDAVAANYDVQELTGDGAVVAAARDAASQALATIPGELAGANIFGAATMLFPAYAESDRHKHRLAMGGIAGDVVELRSGRWESSNPISSIKLYPSTGEFAAGTIAELWGIGRVDDNIYVEVGGTEIANREDGSLSIRNAIQERSTCSFTVVDSPGTASYSKGQPVEVLQHTHPLFGGIIQSVKRTKLFNSTTVHHQLTCVGYEALAGKRLAAASYTGQTAEHIVRDLLSSYLNDEGIYGGVIETGPTLTEALLNYAPIDRAMTRLAERSGFIWGVDSLRRLYFHLATSTPAPWAVDTSMMTKLSMSSTQQAPKYRNRQYVRAGRDVTAPQVETLAGDGANVAFTVGYPIAQVPTVTVAGAGQTVGIKGLDPAGAFQCYWSKSDPVIVFTAAPALAAAVVITYVGEFNILVVAENIPEILDRKDIEGGTGLWENLEDEPSIIDSVEALDSAEAKLDKYAIIGERVPFKTMTPDFEPGQLASVTWLGAAQDMLIESVVITELKPDKPAYSIVAIIGPSLGHWSALFGGMAERTDRILDRLTVGQDEILLVLAKESGNWEWTDTDTETVFACAVPNVGPPYPSLTLFPC